MLTDFRVRLVYCPPPALALKVSCASPQLTLNSWIDTLQDVHASRSLRRLDQSPPPHQGHEFAYRSRARQYGSGRDGQGGGVGSRKSTRTSSSQGERPRFEAHPHHRPSHVGRGKQSPLDTGMSADRQFPAEAQVLTACQTPPIATAALLTYLMLRPLHPNVQRKEGWRAVVGAHGDLGPVKWGTEPWPAELGDTLKA